MTDPEKMRFTGHNLSGEGQLTSETQRIFDEVGALDPELLESPETRQLVAIGAAYIHEVTNRHGSPDAPAWYAGTVDHAMMTYHNGESDIANGHTSAGADGAGVPRNALSIALTINARAGYQVVGPLQRALLFVSGAAHDFVQLCGRSVAVAEGDERLSADHLYETLLSAGHSEAVAQEGARYVMATMYDPSQGRHVIATEGMPFQTILGQQIVAAADLLSPVTEFGALGSMQWTLEEFGLGQKNRVLHAELTAQGLSPADVADLPSLLAFVDATPDLKQRFVAGLRGQAGWIEDITYSDSAIRMACGAGINDMFPGRAQTAANLRALADYADQGAPLRELFRLAGASYL